MSAKRDFLCLLVMFFSLIDIHASWPGFLQKGNHPSITRTAWRELSPEAEVRFDFLVNRRNEIRSEMNMLDRLLEEKTAEQDQVILELKLAFAVAPDKSYRFDRSSNSLYLLPVPPQNGKSTTSVGAVPEGKLHQSLTESQTTDFLQLAEVRQQAQLAIQGLLILKQQKLKQWERVCDELENTFGIQRDRTYNYDKDKRMIYLLDSKTTISE